MSLFEKRLFLFNNRAIVFLESSPDCLRKNRGGNNVVDVMGSLDSIIKLSSSDLAKNGLFVTRGVLGQLRNNLVEI